MKKHTTQMYNTPYQLKLPLEIEKIIEISDPVYTFSEVLNQIDLKRYLVFKENRTGRRRFDSETLLKVILFSFMEHGYVSTREIEKLCKTDIRFMWLLQEEKAPSHMTIDNFMNHCLTDSIENIFNEINRYIEMSDKETLLQTHYTADCMYKRNRYMVDKSDYVIAVWNGSPSGTGKTVLYAKENNKEIIQIKP